MKFVRYCAIFTFFLTLNNDLVKSCDIFRKINVNLYDDTVKFDEIVVENVTIPNLCRNAIRNLKELYAVKLIQNEMYGIEPGAFNNLPSLRKIIIQENKLSTIEEGVFNSLSIRELDLAGNLITKIDENAFTNMRNLEVLTLDRNKIKTIQSTWFKDKPKFYRLCMMDNSLNVLQEDLFKHLSGNKQNNPSRFSDLQFWLSNNVLSEINVKAFDNIERIDTLSLDDNQLDEEIFDGISHIKIQRLRLRSNRIKCIDEKLLKKLKVKELSLDDNPLDCNCLKSMRKAANSNKIHLWALKKNMECLNSERPNLFDN